MKISISGKTSDLFSAILLDADDKQLGEYNGYVPSWFPSPNTEHYGDYIDLEIDLETGQILNWKKPTQSELNKTFKAPANG
jgi:hypothetical protein